MLVDIWGWICAIVGSFVSVPQVVRLLRAPNSAGVSLLLWQFNSAAAIAWAVHGLRGGWWNIAVPNVLVALTSLLVVRMVVYDRRTPSAPVWSLVAGVAAALVAVEFWTTPALFGMTVAVPLAAGMLGQSLSLVRAPVLSGVSAFFVAMSFLIQAMWLSWALAVNDTSIVICAGVLGVISLFNVAWYALRSRGVVQGLGVA